MNITLFNKKYTIRRFKEQKEYKGYLVAEHEDFVASIHVHPTGSDQIQALSEGERRVTRLEGHGNIQLLTADQIKDQKGDLLLYRGEWYECISSQLWDHTILSHYNYQFVLVPSDVPTLPSMFAVDEPVEQEGMEVNRYAEL